MLCFTVLPIVLSILFVIRPFRHASEIDIDMDLQLLFLDRSQESYRAAIASEKAILSQ